MLLPAACASEETKKRASIARNRRMKSRKPSDSAQRGSSRESRVSCPVGLGPCLGLRRRRRAVQSAARDATSPRGRGAPRIGEVTPATSARDVSSGATGATVPSSFM